MKVLIVEDDPILSEIWDDVLSEADFDVVSRSTSASALVEVLKTSFDLVVLDLFVRDGSTIALANTIALRQPDTSIMLVTGSGVFPRGEHKDLAAGIDWILRKPIRPSELQAMARYLVSRRSKNLGKSETQVA